MTINRTTRLTVSILGLGLMGAALAEALLDAGHLVTVWNRTPAKTEPLTAKGARPAGSVADALDASDVAIICVLDHAATMAVLGAIQDRAPDPGKCLVVLTTMSPEQSAEAARWAAKRGCAYVEGSILGIPDLVTAGRATIVAAGSNTAFAASEPVLRAFGGGKHLSEEIGAAVSFDQVFYAYGYGVMFAFLQGAAMAHAKGYSVPTFSEIVTARLPALETHFSLMSAAIAARDYSVTQSRADVWAEGYARTLSLCRELGVDDTLPSAIWKLFERNSAAGRADDELSSIFETLIDRAGASASQA